MPVMSSSRGHGRRVVDGASNVEGESVGAPRNSCGC